ncbi:MAG: hypothetical protein JXA68_03325 [Ignavibacteriales bacterium]|nr:hypothetical protein [Ignavibacteriales bacterium]
MRLIIVILILFTQISFGQTWTKGEIEDYCSNINKLKSENDLIKVFYPNMSACGGGLNGYYQGDKLLFISSTYSAELGYSSKTVYFKDNKTVKIIYREHYAEWGKYEEKYPSDKYEWNPDKMTYSDTLYSISFSSPISFEKSSYDKFIDNQVDYELIKRLTDCTEEMRNELGEVLSQVDSLKYITEMPYMCRYELCGDNLFWDVVQMRQGVIELLIDKLDDTTLTKANVVLFGGDYKVADIAYVALKEIIQDIPTFELLGVEFDKNGCGYCSYWNHLNEDFKNRLEFKNAVKDWYFKNKDNLIWIADNKYTSCDCQAKHPNGGHFEIKK